jgi:hypothetical protein
MKAIDLTDNEIVAVKIVKKSTSKYNGIETSILS